MSLTQDKLPLEGKEAKPEQSFVLPKFPFVGFTINYSFILRYPGFCRRRHSEGDERFSCLHSRPASGRKPRNAMLSSTITSTNGWVSCTKHSQSSLISSTDTYRYGFTEKKAFNNNTELFVCCTFPPE